MKFEPVAPGELPNVREGRRGRVSYPILKSFLETGLPVAKMDRTGMQNSLMSLTSCLNSYINNHHLPIKVFQRSGELYLMRTDIEVNPDGSVKEGQEVATSLEDLERKPQQINTANYANATPITSTEVEKRFAEEIGQATK